MNEPRPSLRGSSLNEGERAAWPRATKQLSERTATVIARKLFERGRRSNPRSLVVVARGPAKRVGLLRRGRRVRRHCVLETMESCASLPSSVRRRHQRTFVTRLYAPSQATHSLPGPRSFSTPPARIPVPQTWRYRLGVRTVGSQPSNRGSNPRSATTLSWGALNDPAPQTPGAPAGMNPASTCADMSVDKRASTSERLCVGGLGTAEPDKKPPALRPE